MNTLKLYQNLTEFNLIQDHELHWESFRFSSFQIDAFLQFLVL